MASQTLGYVGVDDEGLGGIEHGFDEELRGKPGKMQIVMDARRKWFGRVEREPDPGSNIVLTIDEKNVDHCNIGAIDCSSLTEVMW